MVNNGRPEWPHECCEYLAGRHTSLRVEEESAQSTSKRVFDGLSRCLLRKERQRVALARGDAKLEMMARSLNNSSNSDLKLTSNYETSV